MSSSRLAGRRVSMAPNRIRRSKRDSSGLAEGDEEGNRSGRNKNAIFNDEIASLQIREEDLIKVSQEARANLSATNGCSTDRSLLADESTILRRVAVRKEIPEALRQPPLRRIVLLRRAPPDAPLITESDTPSDWWRPGPRLDSRGKVVAHSLLGRPEEFFRMGLLRGHLKPKDVPPAYRPEDWDEIVAALRPAESEEEAIENERQHADLHAAPDDIVSLQDSGCSSRLTFGGPPLPTTDEADPLVGVEISARERNRQTWRSGSSLAVNRLTEQVNQCGMTSSLRQHPTGSCADNWDIRRTPSWQQHQQHQQLHQPDSVWRRSSLRSTPPLRSPLVAWSPGSAESAGSAATGYRSVKLAGPRYSFIGGWNYQKEILLGRDENRF